MECGNVIALEFAGRDRVQKGWEQPRKACLKGLAAQCDVTPRAFHAALRHAGFAEHLQMVAERGLRHGCAQLPPAAFFSVRQDADDAQPGRIAEYTEQARQRDLGAGGRRLLQHAVRLRQATPLVKTKM